MCLVFRMQKLCMEEDVYRHDLITDFSCISGIDVSKVLGMESAE